MNTDAGRVIVDTSALIALMVSTDRFHDRASQMLADLMNAHRELWLCSYALTEFMAIVMNRFGFKALETFLDSQKELMEVVWVSEGIHSEAWAEFASREGAGPNFVDWTVIVTARHLGARIFTFDSDFLSAGVDVMPHRAR